jgi:hypothetical protein
VRRSTMLQEDNELLTRIGPSTRMGALLRRYWWPIGASNKVSSKPVPTRVLGENLILFRDGNGKVGLVDRVCPHRSASLEFGRVEKDGMESAVSTMAGSSAPMAAASICRPSPRTVRSRNRSRFARIKSRKGQD